MILYDTKKWGDSLWKIFLSLHWGNNYKILLRSVSFVAIYASIITYVNINFFHIKFRIDPFYFSLLGLILSLFLVFRLNSSYNKWWEGRQLWGALINTSRTLSAYLAGVLGEELQLKKRYFAAQISNFAYALSDHLRGDIQFEQLDVLNETYIKQLKATKNVPHKISAMMFGTVQDLYRQGQISDIDKLNIKNEIGELVDILGACERIKNTPIPFSHSSFFKSFILIYIIALPFGFVNDFLYFTIPATLLISYALLGVEIISEEIEEPFGKDPNDLPTTFLAGIIRRDIYNILDVENKMPEIQSAKEGSGKFRMIH